jgi:hypothetical protein
MLCYDTRNAASNPFLDDASYHWWHVRDMKRQMRGLYVHLLVYIKIRLVRFLPTINYNVDRALQEYNGARQSSPFRRPPSKRKKCPSKLSLDDALGGMVCRAHTRESKDQGNITSFSCKSNPCFEIPLSIMCASFPFLFQKALQESYLGTNAFHSSIVRYSTHHCS